MSAVLQSCVYFPAGREDSTDTCSICLTAFVESEHLARHTACNNRFHAICLFEWRVTQNIQRQRARCPLCRGHLYTFTTPATRAPLSDFREGEIVRLRLTVEVVSSSRRTTASGSEARSRRFPCQSNNRSSAGRAHSDRVLLLPDGASEARR